MKIWMAPMHGLTGHVFRNLWFRHFLGVDEVITPFVSLMPGDTIKSTLLTDFLPENNTAIKPIPQVIGNKPEQLITMSKALHELGYSKINLNLGCPSRQVVKHRRGSGLLPHPKDIDAMLSAFFTQTNLELSVKIRIGLKSTSELTELLEVLNRYPLDFVCIHPRLGTQQYEGTVDLSTFEDCLNTLKHRIIYSGDITTVNDYKRLSSQFPTVTDWMIGRKMICNPFFPGQIKGIYPNDEAWYQEKFIAFHKELLEDLMKHHKIEVNALNKAKEYWKYFSYNTATVADDVSTMLRCNILKDFQEMAERIAPRLRFIESI